MLNPTREVGQRRRVRLRWSCCNTCMHEHRFFITAWICGRVQYFWREVMWS